MIENVQNYSQNELIEAINSSKLGTVRKLTREGIDVDCLDHNGMSPLQHACYKGDVDICHLLIDHGADVNDNRHHHGYTALMFAALSGNKQVVSYILSKGADATVVNSVKRTAAQMASFVGRHEIASIINNFINMEDLKKFSNIKDKDGNKLLTPALLTSLHQYILTSNFNPVHLASVLKGRQELLQNSGKVGRVLEEVVEDLMKRKETDESAAIKIHYFSSYLQQAVTFMGLTGTGKCSDDTKVMYEEAEFDKAFNKWLRFLMKRNTPLDSPPPNQELVIRRSLLSFPFHQSQLFQQIVSTVSLYGDKMKRKDDGKDNDGIGNLSAMTCLFNAINGQRIKNEEDDKQCASCEEFNGKACNVCRSVYYCNKDCQKLHWSVHKVMCAQMKERKDRMDRLKEQEEKKNKEDTIAEGIDADKIKEIKNDDTTVDKSGDSNDKIKSKDKTYQNKEDDKDDYTDQNIEKIIDVDQIQISDGNNIEIKTN